MSKLSKVYKYYYKANTDDIMKYSRDSDKGILDKYPLYAITDIKDYAEEFEMTRNMGSFIVKVDKLDTEEYNELLEYLDAYDCVLDRYRLTTRKNDCKIDHINMIMTKFESTQVLEEQSLYNLEDPSFWAKVNPFKFNKKLFKALTNLQYVAFYKLMQPYFISSTCSDDEDVPAPAFQMDEFYLLTRLFSGTF